MNKARAERSLEHNSAEIQVMLAMTIREHEARLQALRTPIYKDLIGWRVNTCCKPRNTSCSAKCAASMT